MVRQEAREIQRPALPFLQFALTGSNQRPMATALISSEIDSHSQAPALPPSKGSFLTRVLLAKLSAHEPSGTLKPHLSTEVQRGPSRGNQSQVEWGPSAITEAKAIAGHLIVTWNSFDFPLPSFLVRCYKSNYVNSEHNKFQNNQQTFLKRPHTC